jgi:hypothetical protein
MIFCVSLLEWLLRKSVTKEPSDMAVGVVGRRIKLCRDGPAEIV